jgi:lysophospholipase L1-like esterase
MTASLAWSKASGTLDAAAFERSEVSLGDAGRFHKVFEKAKRGEDVTMAVIGGSISTGSLATQPDVNGYPALLETWWRATFPRSRLLMRRAGVAGTGSLFGALRVGHDVLEQPVDAVIIEFAVNDAWTDQEPFEGLVRHVLSHPSHPAVLLLFMSYASGHNEQEWQQAIGTHYGLPMVSFRDAVWPLIDAGTVSVADVLVDIVHPNNRGHRIVADLLCAAFDALEALPVDAAAGAGTLPRPLYSTRFENARWLPADVLTPEASEGWQLRSNDNLHPVLLGHPVWVAGAEARPLRLTFQGTGLVAMLMLDNQDDRSVNVTIDGQVAQRIGPDRQPRRNVFILAEDLPGDRTHTLELSSSDAVNGAPAFGVFGIGVLL